MSDLLDMIDEIDITDSKTPTPVNKKPPKAPNEIQVDQPNEIQVNKITFEEIANSSEFKRLVYLIQFGKTHRGKSEDLERKLIKRQEEITIIKEIERGSKGAFKAVVKELKEKLAKQKVKVENGTD